MTRFGFRQRDPVASAVAADHVAQRAPIAAIVGRQHGIRGRMRTLGPIDAQAAEFGGCAEIERQPLRAGARTPDRSRIAIECLAGVARSRGDARGCDARFHDIGRQRREAQIIEADRSFAADAVVERELQLRAVPQHRVGARPPRLADVPAFVVHRRPLAGECVFRAIDPPDIVAAGVDQLELQIVGRRFAAQPEIEAIVVRIGNGDIALHADIAGDAVEVVIHAECAVFRADRPGHLRRCDDAPLRGVVEGVEGGSGVFRPRAATGYQHPNYHVAVKQLSHRKTLLLLQPEYV